MTCISSFRIHAIVINTRMVWTDAYLRVFDETPTETFSSNEFIFKKMTEPLWLHELWVLDKQIPQPFDHHRTADFVFRLCAETSWPFVSFFCWLLLLLID